MHWSPGSWRRFEARQQPDYADPGALEAVCAELARRPALVDLGAIDALRLSLAAATQGRAFLVQGGDCAELLDAPPEESRAMAALLARLQDAVAATIDLPIITIGRIAGQFAKPRSRPVETRGDRVLPAWRGDSVNAMAFEAEARAADPARLLRAYDHAATTRAVLPPAPALHISHEALLLPFEQALIREDAASGRRFAGSAHFLWIGARTLFPGSAHVELLRGVANPVGLKIGPDLSFDALTRLLEELNPDRIPGRITLIARIGADGIRTTLPGMCKAVAAAGHPVLWCCDPLHGNTRQGAGGKRRRMADIEAETLTFVDIVEATGQSPAGLHLEMTHRAIVECDDGVTAGERDRDECRDPRLNADQALRIARLAAAALAGKPMPARLALA